MIILENSMFILEMGPLLKIFLEFLSEKYHQLKTTQESEIVLLYRAFILIYMTLLT